MSHLKKVNTIFFLGFVVLMFSFSQAQALSFQILDEDHPGICQGGSAEAPNGDVVECDSSDKQCKTAESCVCNPIQNPDGSWVGENDCATSLIDFFEVSEF